MQNSINDSEKKNNSETRILQEINEKLSYIRRIYPALVMLLIWIGATELDAKEIFLETWLDQYCYANALVYGEIFTMLKNWASNDLIFAQLSGKYFKNIKNSKWIISEMTDKIQNEMNLWIINQANADIKSYFYSCKFNEISKNIILSQNEESTN